MEAEFHSWIRGQILRDPGAALVSADLPRHGFAMPSVLALFAHPDDIEFRAAGTLLLLRRAGWDVHCCNLSQGDLGSSVHDSKAIARIRAAEARAACTLLGFHWHPPIGKDLQLIYSDGLIRRVCALVRRVRPRILLTHPLSDYMEDHMETARMAVTAAFARGIPNYRSRPPVSAVLDPVTLYHSTPHGLRGPMGEPHVPGWVVDVTLVLSEKRAALACHRSQKEWLDVSQGMDSYLAAMEDEGRRVGERAGIASGEGWTRHSHLGFCGESDDPLAEVLRDSIPSGWRAGKRQPARRR